MNEGRLVNKVEGALVFDVLVPGKFVLNWKDNMVEVYFGRKGSSGERLFIIDMNNKED
jgi:hypothetical protein